MSLDAPMSEAQILAEHAKRRGRRETTVGVEPRTRLSPFMKDPRTNPPSDDDGWSPIRSDEITPGAGSPLRNVQAKRARRPYTDREHPLQAAVIAWADDPSTLPEYPELKTIFAVPNARGSGGASNKRKRQLEAARQRAEGLRKGQPDLTLPTPRRDHDGTVYGALYVEMKSEEGAVRQSQHERIAMLRAAGNKCEVAMSVDTAKAIITMYLQLPRP